MIERLPQGVTAHYLGPSLPQDVWQYYADNDAFALPTLDENYGFVIEDALLAGCVPVISDRTPWSSLDRMGAGFVLPLEDRAAWIETLGTLWAMDEQQFSIMRRRCSDLHATLRKGGVADDYQRLFLDPLIFAISRSHRPGETLQ